MGQNRREIEQQTTGATVFEIGKVAASGAGIIEGAHLVFGNELFTGAIIGIASLIVLRDAARNILHRSPG